jgi:hypothetical protein
MEFRLSRLDKGATITTIFVTALLVALSAFFIIKVPYGWVVAILMMSIIVFSYLLSPTKYQFDGSRFVIQKVIGKRIIIALEDIEGYALVPDFSKLRVARTFGNGGLFGYYGTFSTIEYGTLSCQLTNLKQVFIMKTNRGTFAISPADTVRFEEHLVNSVKGITGEIKPLIPTKPEAVKYANPLILILPLALFTLTAIMVLALYQQLPERIAVHFDFHGNPDGWSSRTSFIISGFIPATVLCAISIVSFFVTRRATAKATLPYMLVALFAVFQLFVAYTTLDTFWINKYDTHPIAFPYNIVGYVVIIVILLVVYYRKTKTAV